MRAGPFTYRQNAVYLLIVGTALCFVCMIARGQQPAAKPENPAAQSKPFNIRDTSKQHFKLVMKKEWPIPTFRLTAKDAKVADIARELSRQLAVPVMLSPAMSKEKATVEVRGFPLETTLRFLAPQPFIDYVSGGDNTVYSKPLAVYLYAFGEAPPSLNETVKSNVQGFFASGDTEEGTEEYESEEEPLDVNYVNSRLSIRADKQPLSDVLFEVAHQLGIPFAFEGESKEIVNTNLKDYPVDEAIRLLSSSVRFYYRLDVMSYQKYPIQLALEAPKPTP